MTAMQNIVSVRASSFSSLFDCAYKWEGQHILGMKMPSSPRAHLGTAIHSGTAIYDLAMLEKIDGFTAKDAAESMLHELRNPEYEVNWAAETDLTLKKAELIALALLDLYTAKIAPNYTPPPLRLLLLPLLPLHLLLPPHQCHHLDLDCNHLDLGCHLHFLLGHYRFALFLLS